MYKKVQWKIAQESTKENVQNNVIEDTESTADIKEMDFSLKKKTKGEAKQNDKGNVNSSQQRPLTEFKEEEFIIGI